MTSDNRKTRPNETPGGSSISRRGVLKAGAAGVATVSSLAGGAALGLPRLAGAATKIDGDWQPDFFTRDQGRLVSTLCELMVPATDTPGALDAGVPEFLDLRVSLDEPDRQLEFLGGLSWIDQRAAALADKRFVELSEAQQIALLEEISDEHSQHPPELRAGAAFFADFKRATLRAYFTSEAGRVEALGRPARVRREEWTGCEHEPGAHSAPRA